jgi:hypothetical protein
LAQNSISPVIDEEPIFWAFAIVRERYSKEARLKFMDVVTTQTSTTSEHGRRVSERPKIILLKARWLSLFRVYLEILQQSVTTEDTTTAQN